MMSEELNIEHCQFTFNDKKRGIFMKYETPTTLRYFDTQIKSHTFMCNNIKYNYYNYVLECIEKNLCKLLVEYDDRNVMRIKLVFTKEEKPKINYILFEQKLDYYPAETFHTQEQINTYIKDLMSLNRALQEKIIAMEDNLHDLMLKN